MLKFLQNSDEVMDLMHSLSACPELKSFRIGFTGSYATGQNKKSSAIDIVLKVKDDGEKSEIGSLDISGFISRFMESAYSNKYQILWLDLLEKDEENVLDFTRNEGVEANPESVYTNIIADVCWADEDEEDEDTVSKSVVTWDEEED